MSGPHALPQARHFIVVAVITAVAMLVPQGPARAHDFGANPLRKVKQRAGNADRCTGLTKNELAAMMLAPTWGESGAGSSGSPSPMAMGRSDFDNDLYSFGTRDHQERAFWHAGVGMWQLDDSGLGTNMTVNQRVAVGPASKKTARYMAGAYCGTSGTPAQRRAAAFRPWFACGNGQCEALYDEHYCGRSDNVCNIDTHTGVGNFGGMKVNQCRWGGDFGSSFTCWFLDIVNAQGDTSFWKSDPKTGSDSITPLAFAFYSWLSNGREVRNWVVDDTSYAREIRAKRRLGRDSRSGLTWRHPLRPMCDTDLRKGTCG